VTLGLYLFWFLADVMKWGAASTTFRPRFGAAQLATAPAPQAHGQPYWPQAAGAETARRPDEPNRSA
jgi:hypothetical protein